MSSSRRMLGIACAVVGAVFVLTAGVDCALAQSLKEQIIDALKPAKTRGLSTSPRDVEEQRGIEALPNTRSLTLSERNKVAKVAKDSPSIDLEVYFDYNSATARRDAMDTLQSLGEALEDPELEGSNFLIAGHTDAKGGDSYNQKLSERRAESVKKMLVKKFKIPAESLLTAGYGKDQLKNTADPFAAENRRVQIVNLQSAKTAGK